jgi:hypothetical protein
MMPSCDAGLAHTLDLDCLQALTHRPGAVSAHTRAFAEIHHFTALGSVLGAA